MHFKKIWHLKDYFFLDKHESKKKTWRTENYNN